MSDQSDAGAPADTGVADAAPAATPAPEPAAAPATATEAAKAAAAAAAAPTTTTDPDPFDGDLPDEQVFSRGYVEKLRKQGQTYREEAKSAAEKLAQFDEVYGVYNDEDRQAWFDIAREWATDPRSGAEMMQRIANAVLNEGKTPEEATEQVIAEDQVVAEAEQDGQRLTPEQVQALVDERLAEQERERAQEAAVQQVFDEIKAAGYEPRSRDGQAILWTANNETDGDIAKAIEIHKAERQKIIDEYVASKSEPSARPAPADGVLASEAHEPADLDQAFKGARDFLKGIATQPG